jgi:hypothetical protein
LDRGTLKTNPMLKASLIYTGITILLALIDAIRIRKAKGIVDNINHKVSAGLACFMATVTVIVWMPKWVVGIWLALGWGFYMGIALALVRVIIFDPSLNIARRMKINYESPTTSSYIDNHSRPIGFWEKRTIGLAGWGILLFVHYAIFKTI